MPHPLPRYDISLLCVEDEQATRGQISRMLEHIVSEIFVAGTGQEGLDLFWLHSPDVVLVDIMMPVMNGLDMVREIRKIDPDCQVIILTAYCDTDYLLDSISLGINQFLRKPVDINHLTNAIRLCNETIQLKRHLKKQDNLIHMLSQAMERAPALVLITSPDGSIEYVNSLFSRVTGYEASEAIGRNPSILKSGINPPEVYQELWRTIKAGNEWEGELANRRKNGQIYWEWIKISPLYDSAGNITQYLKLAQDITERKKYEENLHFLGTHDPLTGLFNRSYFDTVLKRLATGSDYPISIVIVDIDELKKINDTCGHKDGDRVLRMAADSLVSAFRVGDVVSRIGGDEFAILLPNTDEETARATVNRIRNCGDNLEENPDTPPYRFSFGVATALDGSGLECAVRLADERMYLEKFKKKQQLVKFRSKVE